MFSDNSPVLKHAIINQPVRYMGKGSININGAIIGVGPSPMFLTSYAHLEAREIQAIIRVGQGTAINNNASIIAEKSLIEIGARCLIGANFSVMDSDFHGLEIVNRRNGEYDCQEVIVGDDVFIGNNVTILKGVKIECGAVIGSNSLVTSNVEPNAIYAGNPAKFIKYI